MRFVLGAQPAEGATIALLVFPSSLFTQSPRSGDCQSGVWAKGSGAGGGIRVVLYLQRKTNTNPPLPACPASWAETNYGAVASGSSSNDQRTCLSPADQNCAVLYQEIRSTIGNAPACPSGWTEVDNGGVVEGSGAGGDNSRRACIKC